MDLSRVMSLFKFRFEDKNIALRNRHTDLCVAQSQTFLCGNNS
jgi:hypothetical protein